MREWPTHSAPRRSDFWGSYEFMTELRRARATESGVSGRDVGIASRWAAERARRTIRPVVVTRDVRPDTAMRMGRARRGGDAVVLGQRTALGRPFDKR